MSIIEHPDWSHVETTLNTLARQRPEWFPQGFNGIYAVSSPNLFAGTHDGRIYFSDADQLVPGFKPATELASALGKIGAGDHLAFKEEYAVETLWHELMHGMTGIRATRVHAGKDAVEEGLIQSVSRISYAKLLDYWGSQAEHQERIIFEGFAYPQTARNFIEMFNQAGLDPDWLFDLLIHHGDQWQTLLGDALSIGLNIRHDRVRTLYGHAANKDITDFSKKIMVQQRNAPRNNQS